jgi:hypothetical protein
MNRKLLLLIALVSLAPAFLGGQTRSPAATTTTPTKNWTPPKTPWGDPDLQGIWTSDDYIGVGLQRDADLGEKRFFTDQEVADREAAIARQAQADLVTTVAPNARVTVNPPGHWGERARRPPRQTSLVIDPPNGRIPPLTPEAQQKVADLAASRQRQGPGASWESFSFYIRCITRGPTGSIFPVIYGNGLQIVQAPGYVTIFHEMVHEARVIPLDGRPHAGSNIRSYMGDSRGRWEGNTLVIETTNFLPGKTGVQGGNGGGPATSDALKVTERYTRASASTIDYQVTIDDPKTYTAPWKVAFPITQEPGYQLFEYACHEGNYAMFNSLSGSRADEQR